ncbi:MAG TPA: hypothetical protein VIH28_08255 [Ignavibacteriaceae bacterium]
MKAKYDYIIGIDPGTTTGIAIWNPKSKEFEQIFSGKILEVMTKLEPHCVFGKTKFMIENPNLRKWFGKSGREVLQGVGSVKRDYQIWIEWFEINNSEYQDIHPKNIKTKLDAKQFEKITGWKKQTNSHMRDAGMLVFCMG